MQNYSPQDYQAFDQNWSATQDSSGRLFFANGDGVLIYDGTNWDLIELPNKTSAFAVLSSQDGKVYVGAFDEIGYLQADSIGRLVYISLKPQVPKSNQDFGSIRSICHTRYGTFFLSKKYIFLWTEGQFKSIENTGDSNLFLVNDVIYKRIKDHGLTKFDGDKFTLLPRGESFAKNKIYSILPFGEKEVLLITRNKVYIYDNNDLNEFVTDRDDFFRDNIVYVGHALEGGLFALGSLNKGLVVFDKRGKQKVALSQKNLLRSNGILGLFKDRSGILWAMLNSGIAKIEYPSPFTYFNNYNGAPELVLTFLRYNDIFFIGGSEGLYYLDEYGLNGHPEFIKIDGEFEGVWKLISHHGKLIIGSIVGVYEMDQNFKVSKIVNVTVATLKQSGIDTNRIYVGTESGLMSIYRSNQEWEIEYNFPEIQTFVNKIIELKDGSIWLGLNRNELIKISFKNLADAKGNANKNVKVYTPENGLPDRRGEPYLISDELYFVAGPHIHRFEYDSDTFSVDEELVMKLGLEGQKVGLNFVDGENRVWLINYEGQTAIDQMVATEHVNGSYSLAYLGEERVMASRSNRLYEELSDSIIWLKGERGLIRHDLRSVLNYKYFEPKAIVTGVILNSENLLYGGYRMTSTPMLPFGKNQIRFSFTSPSYIDEASNLFQYKLEGFDQKWSSWSSETTKDYTNIHEGNYTFLVRSKNALNQIGAEDRFSFSILPPWYRSWWMYLIYTLVGVGLIWLISNLRSKELKRRNDLLEKEINKRTQEINHKNDLLMHQTEKLVQIDDAKTQLYSNITHEFRTPLTVILGMADVLKEDLKENKVAGLEKSINLIKRNGKNLLHLVNEMLDLAKSESGTMELKLIQADIIPLVKYLSESFNSIAQENRIVLSVHSEIDSLVMDYDSNKITSIISNLISNAIKFTPENGQVNVRIKQELSNGNDFLVISVKDTGMGIPQSDIPKIFDRFYQSESTSAQTAKGTGIGLALTKELVEMMTGTIELHSNLNEGSEFIVFLPVTNNASKVNNIVHHEEASVKVADQESVTQQQPESSSSLPVVLIIEDNKDVAYYLKTSLSSKYETLHSVNGEEGIQMAIDTIPDIIICDVMMPIKNGYEVCAALKSNERTDHIPIIMLTAKVSLEDRLTGLSRGADAYLAKPFNKKELFTRLDQLVLLRKRLIGKIQKEGYSSLLKKKDTNPKILFLQKVVKIIHDEMSNSDFGSAELSKSLLASDSQVYRKIKAITGKSTAVFIRSIRLQHAKDLLLESDRTVSEVAYDVGFNDPSWFSRAFKEEFGSSPRDIGR